MSYTIKQVDQAMKDRILAAGLSVEQDGKTLVVPVRFSYPDQIIAVRDFPAINIESGFASDVSPAWQRYSDTTYVDGVVDPQKVDVTTKDFVDLFWRYKIGYYVHYSVQAVAMEEAFLFLFPHHFFLPVNGENVDCAVESSIDMDETDGDYRIHRRDFIVSAHLWFEKSTLTSVLRPFNGIGLTIGGK